VKLKLTVTFASAINTSHEARSVKAEAGASVFQRCVGDSEMQECERLSAAVNCDSCND